MSSCAVLNLLSISAIISIVTCVLAIAVMIYFKFYRSFNYRLILYLLISFLLYAISLTSISILALVFSCLDSSDDLLIISNFVGTYSLWNILLCIAFMTAEIFSMVIFSVELRKAEILISTTSFILPLYLASASAMLLDGYTFFTVTYLLGVIVGGVCVIAIAIALIVLAYHSLRGCVICNHDNEGQHLLPQHTRQRYRTALKEILPFIIYPIVSFLWLLSLLLILSTMMTTKCLSYKDLYWL